MLLFQLLSTESCSRSNSDQIVDHQIVTISFSGTSLTLESALELLLGATTELVISDCWIKIYIFVTCHNPIKKWFLFLAYNKRRHFKIMIFLICSQLMRHPLIKLFYLSNFLQMSNDHRIDDVKFFSSFSVVVRGQLQWSSQLAVVNLWWLATMLLIFRVPL